MLKLLLGDPNARRLKRYQPIVSDIQLLEEEIAPLSDDDLRARTAAFRQRLENAGSLQNQRPILDEILPEAFAVVREAGKRVLGMRHFDVQLIGGMVLHEGQIAEMKTGEGKTLVATLPSLNALTGRGVHVITVNDYLARRDAEWMGQVHRFLGLSVGLIQQDMRPEERRRNYNCDITYATNSELGFDYLRDNMAADGGGGATGFQFCVIDEVNSILIDEARTPLIISGQVEQPQEKYSRRRKWPMPWCVPLNWAKTASIPKAITRWMKSSAAAPSPTRALPKPSRCWAWRICSLRGSLGPTSQTPSRPRSCS